MDDVARLDPRDRAELFKAVAARRLLTFDIVEKDFWVCWTLKRLFTLTAPPAGLIFKGGTSLSKVFNAIERFSEDVDLSFNRADLGFAGAQDPLNATTGKKRKHGLDDLTEACRVVIRERFLPQLTAAISDALRQPPSETWGLELSPADPSQQTLLFHYPSGRKAGGPNEPAYIQPAVQLEIGARSDPWPTHEAAVTPYAAEDFPHLFAEKSCNVQVLAAERTFWEKATLLHMWHHAPADKPFRDRQSRHYYDVVRLYEKGVGKATLHDTELLLKVAKHKEVFFPAPWAKYAEAKPGSLRLVPPRTRLPELERDYAKTQEMIFDTPPSFEHILAVLGEIEQQVNSSTP